MVTDLTSRRFGRWSVLGKYERRNRRTYWYCVCDCGNERFVLGQNLVNGESKSCGCLNSELASKRMKALSDKINEGKSYSRNTRLYGTWQNMKKRVLNKNSPNYHRYGGRGIKICDDWLSYDSFAQWALSNGYADNLTIDRVNNDGDYEPSNCRWVSTEIQANNKSTNRVIAFHGQRMTMAQVSKTTGLTYETVKYRVNNGIDLDTPKRKVETVFYDGKESTFAELAEKYGLGYSVTKNRIRRNIPLSAPLDLVRSNNRERVFSKVGDTTDVPE